MSPMDEPAFARAMQTHFRNFRQTLAPEDLNHYFVQLKKYPLSAVLKALEVHETAERKGPAFPAAVADIKRAVSKMAHDGLVQGVSAQTSSVQCGHVDERGERCTFQATVHCEGIKPLCGPHFVGRPHAPFPPALVLLARHMDKAAVLSHPELGSRMIDYLDAHPQAETHPAWEAPARPVDVRAVSESLPVAAAATALLEGRRAPRVAEVLAAQEFERSGMAAYMDGPSGSDWD